MMKNYLNIMINFLKLKIVIIVWLNISKLFFFSTLINLDNDNDISLIVVSKNEKLMINLKNI